MATKWLDRVGACASALCAVHCLLVGVALGLMSTLGMGFLANPSTDFVFVGVALFFGIWAFVHGIRSHHSYVPGAFFFGSVVLLVAAHLDRASHRGEVHAHSSLQTALSVLGGLGFVAFHFMNLKLQHVHAEGKCSCQKSSEP